MRRRIFLAVLLAGGIASAQPASRAETLFQEGCTLMKEGRLEEACAKLAESHKLEPAPGTLLNLARCHDEQGKLATALKEYRDVRDRARTEGRPDRQAAADDRIVDLEAKVNRLTIVVPKEAQMPSLVLTLDAATVEASAFGTLLPVDRGAHQILATVDG